MCVDRRLAADGFIG